MSVVYSDNPGSDDSSNDQVMAGFQESHANLVAMARTKTLKQFIPKSRPKITSELDRILKPKHPCTRRDFVSGPTKDKVELEKPFVYPGGLEEFGHQVMTRVWRNDQKVKDLQKKLADRKSAWQKLNDDMKHNLYVEEPPQDTTVYVQDMDPDYLKVIEGRPFGVITTSVRDYIETIRNVLKKRITIGHREDDMYYIDAIIKTEKKMIDIITKNYEKYVDLFQEFLNKDHLSAFNMLKRSNLVSTELYDTNAEFKKLQKIIRGVTISLYKSESIWNVCKQYKKFLYECSPLFWKKENHKLSISTIGSEDARAEPTSPNFGLADLANELNEEDVTLEYILAEVERECLTHDEQQLYFTDPQQLLDLLAYMETQNLNDLAQNEIMAQPLAQIRENMVDIAHKFDTRIKQLNAEIALLESEIEWEEARVEDLEKMAHDLVYTEFKQMVASDEVLYLHCYVEDIYESLIGPNDASLNARQMIELVESFYRNELFYLDKIPSEDVKDLASKTVQEHKMMITFAEKASRQIAELNYSVRAMKRGYEPPYQKPIYKPLMYRSPPLEEVKPPPTPPKEYSQYELDYIEHFTDYCLDNEDNLSQESLKKHLERLPHEDKKHVDKAAAGRKAIAIATKK